MVSIKTRFAPTALCVLALCAACASCAKSAKVTPVAAPAATDTALAVAINTPAPAAIDTTAPPTSTPTPPLTAIGNLVSLDEALAKAVEEFAAQAQVRGDGNENGKTEIAVVSIDAQHKTLSEFIRSELSSLLVSSGKFTVLGRGAELDAVTAEHQLQMSGIVSDKSAVGIGHYLGAKAVVTGEFSSFANFGQLRLRAVDVRSSQILAQPSARIRPDDPVVAGVAPDEADGNKQTPVAEDALARLNSGVDFMKAGVYNKAIAEFTAAIAIDPKLFYGYSHRAFSQLALGSYSFAIADYTSALKISPKNHHSLCNRGVAYAARGDYPRSIADFTAALEVKPKDLDVVYNRGLSYRNMGDNDNAIADFSAMLKIRPNDPTTLTARGIAYHKKGDRDKANADYNAAIKIDPNSTQALYNRGFTHYERGNYDLAIADCEAVLRIAPNDAKARQLIDYIRKKRGR